MPIDAGDLDRIANAIRGVNHTPVLVAIDGQGGAGKSTLDLALVQHLGTHRASVIEGDDFYRDIPEDERAALTPAQAVDRFFDWQRLRTLMESVRASADTLEYRRYDWRHGRLGGSVSSPMPAVVVIEGVYSLRKQLRDLVDVGVWVETPATRRVQRMRDRGENTDEQIDRWEQAELAYISMQAPESIADMRIEGS